MRGHIARLLHDLYVYRYVCARSISEESITLRGRVSFTVAGLRWLVHETKRGKYAFYEAEINAKLIF